MDELFIIDGDWNLNADFTKLTLPYYVATGDSIVAILLAPQQETYCLKTARYMRMVGFRDNRSRNQYCLNVFTWPNVHSKYKNQALSVYVDYHYTRWRLVKELVGLLIELRTEIMKLFVMTALLNQNLKRKRIAKAQKERM